MIDNVHRPVVPIENRGSIVLFFLRCLRACLLLTTSVILLPFLMLVMFLILCAAYADDAIDGKIEEKSEEGC